MSPSSHTDKVDPIISDVGLNFLCWNPTVNLSYRVKAMFCGSSCDLLGGRITSLIPRVWECLQVCFQRGQFQLSLDRRTVDDVERVDGCVVSTSDIKSSNPYWIAGSTLSLPSVGMRISVYMV
jgi:hypothetical protein